LSKNNYKETVWHNAADSGQGEILEKLWSWAKELQLNPEKLRNEVLLSRTIIREHFGTTQHKVATLKY
jgi:hypothetical protein